MQCTVRSTAVFILCLFAATTTTVHAANYVVDQHNPNASDDHAGTADQPFKTISAAVKKLAPGDTISVHAGIYREAVKINVSGTADKPIVIQAAPGEQVVVTGADLVTGWKKIDDPKKHRPIWKKSPWPAWKSYGDKEPSDGDYRGRGAQLIVDNRLYRHVAAVDDLFPGSYCYDPTNDGAIYVWLIPPRNDQAKIDPDAQWWDNPVDLTSADPNKHQVEASVRATNIMVDNQSYVTVRGFTVRYNTAHAQGPGLWIRGNRKKPNSRYDTVEDCVVEYCHGSGLSTSGDHITARRCYVRYNGAIGGGGHLTHSLWEDNVLDANSRLGHGHGWEAGGVKFVRSSHLTVRGCMFINNNGPGLWFDWGNSGNTVERNFCSFNSGSGIMMEVSPHFSSTDADAKEIVDELNLKALGVEKNHPADPNIVRNNICVGNHWDGTWGSGILLQMASNTIVVNNTVIGNDQYGIFVRYHPYDKVGHRCVDNVILNNLLMDNGGSQIYITPDPKDKPGYVARNRSDYNLFWSTRAWLNGNATTRKKDFGWNRSGFSRWGKTQGNGTYSVEEWFKIRGFDQHSIQWDPRLVAPSILDFRLQPSSPAIGAGVVTKYVTDDYLGRQRPTNRPPSIGALEYFASTPARPRRPMSGIK